MKDRKKPDKFLLPHGMPSDDREFAFSSRVPPKALKIKAPYKAWHYQMPTSADVAQCTYPQSDGQPIADNTKQFRWIVTIQGGLDALLRADPQVFLAGDLLWYPVEGHPEM